MANTSDYENIHKLVSQAVLRGNSGTQRTNVNPLLGTSTTPATFNPGSERPEKDQGFNLGQGFIDVLSSGTYATAGIGQKVGENLKAFKEEEDMGGLLDLVNPFSAIGAAGGGLQNRRTWTNNLEEWGADEKTSQWAGLALDIALDPLWLIPGGAIAKGIVGTTKGAALASAATKGGITLSKDAFKSAAEITGLPATRAVSAQSGGVTIADEAQQFFPQGTNPSRFQNLLEGVRQSNVDEYAAWNAGRAQRKELRRAKREGDFTEGPAPQAPESGIIASAIADVSPAAAKSTKVIKDEGSVTAEKVSSEIADSIDAGAAAKAVPDEAKDFSAGVEKAEIATGTRSINDVVREQIEPGRKSYMASKGLDDVEVNYKQVQASSRANEIAENYAKMVNDPTNPAVISSYRRLLEESKEQLDYIVNKEGIDVRFVDEDPYVLKNADGSPRLNADGVTMPDSGAMKADLSNKVLKVYKTQGDQAHPLWSNAENDIFRAVHDFFGHGASGRGFSAGGEEAAWLSHSKMYSAEARKAMTTETRGQNSYYNKFGQFAPQKAGFLNEEFIVTPTEYSAFERRVEGTNSYIGRVTAALQEFSDEVLTTLGLVFSPIKGVKAYSAEEIKSIRSMVDEIAQTESFATNTVEAQDTLKLLNALTDLISAPSAGKYASLSGGEGSITGLLELAERAFDVADPVIQNSQQRALAVLRQELDKPIDATDLLESALRAENRVVTDPKPFSPTQWAPKVATYGKPGFSKDKIAKYFPDDELLADSDLSAIAFGTKQVKAGTQAEGKLARRQEIIWDRFRTRNVDLLDDAAKREQGDWMAENSIENSQLFTHMADGTLVGQGMLPTSIPAATLTVQNGRVTTTLGTIIQNLGKVINRTGPQMGGLPTTQITGGRVARATPTENKAIVSLEGGALEEITVPRAQPLEELGGSGRNAREFVPGARLETPEIKKMRAALKKRGRGIELDSYPVELQSWILAKLDGITANVKKNGIKDARLSDMATDSEALAIRLWDEMPAIKSMSDARLLSTLGPEAVAMLAKKPARRYYIEAPIARELGIPDTAGIGRSTITQGTRNERGAILRDPESGVPVDGSGNVISEKRGIEGGFLDENGQVQKGGKVTDYRIQTDEGKNFTGRVNSKYAAQSGGGAQQLAGLQAVRATIGSINEGIAQGTMRNSKEQAKLLTDVMSSLGIKVAENATPAKVFKTFQQNAPKRFEEIIGMIESAAKSESVTYQLKTVFPMATKENLSLMKAIERIDLGELQQRTVNFTEDALALVDESCALLSAKPAGTILNEIMRGF